MADCATNVRPSLFVSRERFTSHCVPPETMKAPWARIASSVQSRGKTCYSEADPPDVAALALSDYRLQSRASGPERIAGLQRIWRPCLHAGSDARPGLL